MDGSGHGGLPQNRTTKKPHRRVQLWAMGEAGGGLPRNSPNITVYAGAGETSPPAFAAYYLRVFFPITLRFLF